MRAILDTMANDLSLPGDCGLLIQAHLDVVARTALWHTGQTLRALFHIKEQPTSSKDEYAHYNLAKASANAIAAGTDASFQTLRDYYAAVLWPVKWRRGRQRGIEQHLVFAAIKHRHYRAMRWFHEELRWRIHDHYIEQCILMQPRSLKLFDYYLRMHQSISVDALRLLAKHDIVGHFLVLNMCTTTNVYPLESDTKIELCNVVRRYRCVPLLKWLLRHDVCSMAFIRNYAVRAGSGWFARRLREHHKEEFVPSEWRQLFLNMVQNDREDGWCWRLRQRTDL